MKVISSRAVVEQRNVEELAAVVGVHVQVSKGQQSLRVVEGTDDGVLRTV